MLDIKKNYWISFLLILPFVGILLLNASHYHPFFSDDSLISLRYANRLLAGEGLTWSEGKPVEGYSNLLWILLVAIPGSLGVNLIDAARILGVLGMSVIMFAISFYYVGRNRIGSVWFPLSVSLLFLSLGGPVAVWAIGGLEQPLYGMLIALTIPLMYSIVESGRIEKKRFLLLSFPLGLLCLTRPDGPIFTVAAVGSLLITSLLEKSKELAANSLLVPIFPLIFYVGQLLFRIFYYGELVPNTALVKLTPSSHHFFNGLIYFRDAIVALAPFSILAILSLILLLFSSENRTRIIYPVAIFLPWSAYIIFIGGDIFPAFRHFIPLVVVFAFALAEGFLFSVKLLSRTKKPAHRIIMIFLTFTLFIPYTYIQFTNRHNNRAVTERWEWRGRDIGLVLKKAFSDRQPLLAVTAAGCLPYWSELPSLDMLGLNDYYLPRNPPKDLGKGPLGHELGDGKYVLESRPDIIVFHVGSPPLFRSGYELKKMPEFHRLYSPISVKIPEPGKYATVYFNKYSEKIGIDLSPSSISIPGFLFKGKGAAAFLNRKNRLVARIGKNHSAEVIFDLKSHQKWSIEVKASDPDKIRTELKQNGKSISLKLTSKGKSPVEIEEVILRPVKMTHGGQPAFSQF